MKIKINGRDDEYDSCGHFERLCDLVPWTLADEIVDQTAKRLTNTQHNFVGLTAFRRIGMGPGVTHHIKCRNIGTIATHIDHVDPTLEMQAAVRLLQFHVEGPLG